MKRRLQQNSLNFAYIIFGVMILMISIEKEIQTVFWANILLNTVFYFYLVTTALFFSSIHCMANARWYRNFNFIHLRIANATRVFGILLLLIIPGAKHLFSWTTSTVEENIFYSQYFNFPFFLLRLLSIIFIINVLCDRVVEKWKTQKYLSRRVCTLYTIFYIILLCISTYDWLLPLYQKWFSTLFPWYIFSSVLAATVALIIVFSFFPGYKSELFDKKLYGYMAAYLFAFNCFWAYLWFSQYLIIWYGNLPEEITYITTIRQHYTITMIVTFILSFVLPFILLISPVFRMKKWILIVASVSSLVGHYMEFYAIVMSGRFPNGHSCGWMEVLIGIAFLFFFLIITSKGINNLKPNHKVNVEEQNFEISSFSVYDNSN